MSKHKKSRRTSEAEIAEIERRLGLEDEEDESIELDELEAVEPDEPEADDPEPQERDWAKFERKLEADRKAFHAELKRNGAKIDAARLNDLSARQELLDAEKKRVQAEAYIKEQWRQRYLSETFATESDFEYLWRKSLRFEAMREQIESKGGLLENKQRELYRKF